MLRTSRIVSRICQQQLLSQFQRQITVSAAGCQAAQATDPIQKLFVDKVREYAQKSKAAGGALVDATKETKTQYDFELDKVQKQFGVKAGDDFAKFPTFNFTDTELEPVGVNVEAKAEPPKSYVEEEVEDDTPFFVV